jgi:hypothetical protein
MLNDIMLSANMLLVYNMLSSDTIMLWDNLFSANKMLSADNIV